MKLFLVGWVIALASIYSEGVTRCPNKYKVYHQHTHTCFRFVSKKTTFTDCENVCKSKKYMRGPNRTEVGFVARLDEETDKFIKDIIADKWDSSDFWIGLSDAGKKEQYIWRDSDKTPHYFGWRDGEPNKNVDKRYTVISSAGWRKVDRNELHNCLCEVNAVFQMEIISPVAPLRIGHLAMNAFSYFFSDHWQWDKVSWYPPREGEVVKCTHLQDGSKACQSLKTGYTGRPLGDTYIRIEIDISNVGYQDEGQWKCDVSYEGKSLGEETITVKVYEPAQNISCYHQMSPTGLDVTCKTPKIYPRPDDCRWYYNYSHSNENSQNILNSISEQSTNTSGPQSDMTYAAECKLSLKKTDFEFRPGNLTVSVAMDPIVEGRDNIRNYSSVYQDHTVSLVFQVEIISLVAPLRIGHLAMNAFSCSFSDLWQWDKVSWYSPREGEVVKCTHLHDGSCQSLKTGYTGRRSGDTNIMIEIDIYNVGYQDGGQWKCDVSYQGKSLGAGTITVKVDAMKDSDSSDMTTIIVVVVVLTIAITLAIVYVVVLVIFLRKKIQGRA